MRNNGELNKTVLILLIVGLAALGIVALTLTALFRPDASATLLTGMGQFFISVGGFGGIVYGLVKVNEKVELVHKQTNGTLSKKDDEIKVKDAVILEQTQTINTLTKERDDV